MNGSDPIRDGDKLLPGPFRLDSSKYKAVFAGKRSFYGQTLVLWVMYSPDAGRRAGVVVSKRTFRRAVDRNRSKRLMRESFRLRRQHLIEKVDVILIARSGIAGRTCQDVMQDLERVCRRAKLWQMPAAQGVSHV
jgi:ribonuclease P protein component